MANIDWAKRKLHHRIEACMKARGISYNPIMVEGWLRDILMDLED